jgi:uncharacterized membrane protein
MKEVLSVFTFGIGALCLAAFLTILTPKPINAAPGPSKPSHCNTDLSPTHQRQRHMVATVSGTRRMIPNMAPWTKSQPTSFAGGADFGDWLLAVYGDATSCNGEHRFV